ncbi:MAG TPA: DUF4149 domain-containing protein [Blastocatellia bacterium]|nr:DUF4149 domain-containing protein [Blastocatellia bacterium]
MAEGLETDDLPRMATGASSTTLVQIVAFAEVLLLGVWLGAMGFFSFAVPQSGFSVLPSRQLVGLLVTSTITKVEVVGLILGGLLILIQLGAWSLRGSWRWIRLALVILMTAAMALSRFWITPEMVSIRNAMGPMIEEIPATDPSRMAFNTLHGYSVGSLMVAMIAGVATLFLTVRSWFKR